MRSKSLTYMPALDGLRGLAVLLVFAAHAFPWLNFPGGLGVDVFFVISGWLITRILLKEYRATGRIRVGRFYVRRLLRLYPALIAVTATFIALWFTLGRPLSDILQSSFWAVTYLSNIAITSGWSTVDHLMHTWSLAMEEQFYLVWPVVLIVLLWAKVPRKVVVVALVLGAVASLFALFATPDLPYGPLSRASGLLVGCTAAFLVEKKPWESTSAAVISVLVIGGLIFANMTHAANSAVVIIAVIALTPFVLLHAAFGESLLTKLLSARWLVHVGLISYGLYLWHYPVLKALIVVTDMPGGLRGIVALVVSLIAATLSYRFIERPMNKIKDRLGAKKTPAPERESASIG